MKRVFILIILINVGVYSFSQVVDPSVTTTKENLTKEQKLEKQKAEKEETARMVDKMVQQKRFVLEANYISDQTGRRIIVSGELNFVRVDSSQIIVQIAPISGMAGPNGLGGITAGGSINKWELRRFGKNKQLYSVNISATFTRAGFYDILLTINPNGTAQGTLSGPDAAKILFYGRLVDIYTSKVFKGSGI
jgi:hypothetical protein